MATDTQTQVACDIKDLGLADLGKRRTEWAFQSMPVLQTIRKQFIKTQPLKGIKVAACLHVTTETANLMITLRDGGLRPFRQERAGVHLGGHGGGREAAGSRAGVRFRTKAS